jgi:hypothetical protein
MRKANDSEEQILSSILIVLYLLSLMLFSCTPSPNYHQTWMLLNDIMVKGTLKYSYHLY